MNIFFQNEVNDSSWVAQIIIETSNPVNNVYTFTHTIGKLYFLIIELLQIFFNEVFVSMKLSRPCL